MNKVPPIRIQVQPGATWDIKKTGQWNYWEKKKYVKPEAPKPEVPKKRDIVDKPLQRETQQCPECGEDKLFFVDDYICGECREHREMSVETTVALR